MSSLPNAPAHPFGSIKEPTDGAKHTPSQSENPLPTAAPTYIASRHNWLAISFLLVVMLPTIGAVWYMCTRAADQYVSTVAFSVRSEEALPALELLGGLGGFGGSGAANDTDILYEFLRSEEIVARLESQLNLTKRYAAAWPSDPIFAYNPTGTLENLVKQWQRQVRVVLDNSSNLIMVESRAFTPRDALSIAQGAFAEASSTINRLSEIAREDATGFAQVELERARQRLTTSRQALTAFRMRTQIVDPSADLAAQMGVISSLQAKLAGAMIDYDTLRDTATEKDPRVIQGNRKIEAIRTRIAEEREQFSRPGVGPDGESYAQMMAEYEKRSIDLEFSETAYRSAQTAYELALANGRRQSRYLAAHIEPRMAEVATHPDRFSTIIIVFGTLLIGWSGMLLVYYSIRDRR